MSLQDLNLLTLADVADLLHCSKAYVCKAVAGRVAGVQRFPLSRRAAEKGRRKKIGSAPMAVPERGAGKCG
jgi:hypothetical protein